MTAPDVDPPLVFWSPTVGVVWQEDGTYVAVADGKLIEHGFAQPTDGIELTSTSAAGCEHLDGPYRRLLAQLQAVREWTRTTDQGVAAAQVQRLLGDWPAAAVDESGAA